jgi:hypothetical protein
VTRPNGRRHRLRAAHPQPPLHAAGPQAADCWIRDFLYWDRHYTARGEVPPVFSYFLARPRKDVLRDTARLRSFRDEEDRREARARAGVYSFADDLTMLHHRLKLRLRLTALGRRLWGPR